MKLVLAEKPSVAQSIQQMGLCRPSYLPDGLAV